MSNKISALIFSINEYELVYPKIKLLYPYVDEIVIIDSSTDKNQKRLMKNLEKKYNKVRVIWLPPLGVADFYYKIGINECKYEWIFQLDADDIPSKKLLKDLRKLVNDKYDAYKIYRNYEDYKIFRLYRKDVAVIHGLILYLITVKGRNFLELNESEYYIFSPYSFKNYKEKTKKYAFFDSYQQFHKLFISKYFIEGYSPFKFFFETYFISKIFHKVRESYILSIFVWLLYFMMNLFYLMFNWFKTFTRVGSSAGIKYSLTLFQYFMSSTYKRYLLFKIDDSKNFCLFMGLDSIESLENESNNLKFENNGVDNFIKLLSNRLLKKYKSKIFAGGGI